jgi:hypothetical protein
MLKPPLRVWLLLLIGISIYAPCFGDRSLLAPDADITTSALASCSRIRNCQTCYNSRDDDGLTIIVCRTCESGYRPASEGSVCSKCPADLQSACHRNLQRSSFAYRCFFLQLAGLDFSGMRRATAPPARWVSSARGVWSSQRTVQKALQR